MKTNKLNSSNISKRLNKLFSYANEYTAIKNCNGNSELIIAVKKHYERASATATEKTVRQFCYDLIKAKAETLLNAIPDEGYSMGSIVSLTIGSPTVKKFRQDRTREYAKSSKFRAVHGSVDVRLTPSEFRFAKNIAGLLTVIYPQKSKVKKCFWFEGRGAKQYFELVKVDGYIFEGFHAKTKQSALEGGMKIIEIKKLAEKSQKAINKAMRRQYTFADSLLAGNCEAGTRAFALRLNLDTTKKYRGSFLLKQAELKSTNSAYYVRRMINYFAK